MNESINKALMSESIKTGYQHAGIALPLSPNTVDSSKAFVSHEVQKWATVVRQSGTEMQ